MSDSRRTRAALTAMSQIDSYLSACQLGITMASIGLGFAGEPALGHLIEGWLGDSLSAGASTAISVAYRLHDHHCPAHRDRRACAEVGCDLQAGRGRALARRPAEHLQAHFLAGDHGAERRGQPVGRNVRDPAGVEMELGATGEDLRALVEHGRSHATLDPGEAHMLSGVFELHENEARNVMTPIPAVVTIDVDDTVEVALRRCTSSATPGCP